MGARLITEWNLCTVRHDDDSTGQKIIRAAFEEYFLHLLRWTWILSSMIRIWLLIFIYHFKTFFLDRTRCLKKSLYLLSIVRNRNISVVYGGYVKRLLRFWDFSRWRAFLVSGPRLLEAKIVKNSDKVTIS